MIVLVVDDGLLDELTVETHGRFHLSDKLLINREFLGMKAEVFIYWLVQLKEGVISQTFDIYSLQWICLKNPIDDI